MTSRSKANSNTSSSYITHVRHTSGGEWLEVINDPDEGRLMEYQFNKLGNEAKRGMSFKVKHPRFIRVQASEIKFSDGAIYDTAGQYWSTP